MEDMTVEEINKLRGNDIDAGPCRISTDRFRYLNHLKYTRDLTKQEIADYLGMLFYIKFGYNLDLNNPVTYNEKLNWLKVNHHDPVMHQCVDKATFDDFVWSRLPGQNEHHVPKLAILYSPDEMTDNMLTSLPENFLMKSNFGSNAQRYVNRSTAYIDELRESITRYLNPHTNHYFNFFEFGYKDIRPAVVIEKLIELDYKLEFYCTNGEPFMYRVVKDAGTKNACSDQYTMGGKRMKVKWPYENLRVPYKRPDYFEQVLENARILSLGFPHVRVDYHVNRKTWYFNELTFYPWAGLKPFDPYEVDVFLGSKINLDQFKAASCA